jgi:hypothetical protein
MATLGKIIETGKIILARAGDITSRGDPTPGDPHELTLCVEFKTIDVHSFHVPLTDVIDEAKAHCLKWAWTESKEWPNTLAARLEEAARAMLDAAADLRAGRNFAEPRRDRSQPLRQ